jgi:hypothetical protein
MKTEKQAAAYETIALWFKKVGILSNEALYLNIEGTRHYISNAEGEVATSMWDWDVDLDFNDVLDLADVCAYDIDSVKTTVFS